MTEEQDSGPDQSRSYPPPPPPAVEPSVSDAPVPTPSEVEQDLTLVQFGEPVDIDAAKAAAGANTKDNPTAPVRSNVFPGEDLTQ